MSSYNLRSRQNITDQTSNSSCDEEDIFNNEKNMQNHQLIQDAVQELQDLRNLTTRQTISPGNTASRGQIGYNSVNWDGKKPGFDSGFNSGPDR